jgi:hypothetical protein
LAEVYALWLGTLIVQRQHQEDRHGFCPCDLNSHELQQNTY